jgi:hypothetical protein
MLPECSSRQRPDPGRNEVIGNPGDFTRPVSLWLAGLFFADPPVACLRNPKDAQTQDLVFFLENCGTS